MNAPKINMLDGLNMALTEAMQSDPSVMLIGEDIADGQGGGILKVTQGLSTRFGTSRVRSTPIAEQAIIGAAIGAAIAGMRPVAEIMMMNFSAIAMDQIINHAAKLRFMSGGQTSVPLTIRTMTATGFGLGGQHSDMLEAWFCHTPGLKVVIPSSPSEAKGLLLGSIFEDDPVIFIECLPLYYVQGPAPEPGLRIALGKANVVREGSDVTVIGYGRSVAEALKAADVLKGEGVSVEVVDLRTISPFDAQTVLDSVVKTRRAVVVHDAVKSFGVGAEVSSRIHEELFDHLAAPVQRVASQFCPVPFSKPLEAEFLYDATRLQFGIRRTLEKRSNR